ncbi:intracellular coagulation inhibitor 2-like [Ixodes scapularis]|uniref:intracellular coagulation inhibitor 2-like n=1 Tax=Ixodes scapularis TaxID=6945 RepID=UPI001A9F62F6|nr:intracellular coagulation inhibitor 2-like [Ixodes scapularis]
MSPRGTFLLSIATLAAAGHVSAQGDETELARANSEFGLSLLKELCSTRKPQENVFFSPSSIFAALTMVYAGAKGRSAADLETVLGLRRAKITTRDAVLGTYRTYLNNLQSPSVTLKIANAALVDKRLGLLESYKRDLAETFSAKVRSVDFQNNLKKVVSEINQWFKSKTSGKISDMASEESLRGGVMVLMNAIYFKGSWKNAFDTNQTSHFPFYNGGIEPVQVKTMTCRSTMNYCTLPELKSQAVQLPYSGDRYSMVIVLPNDRAGLPQLIRALSVRTILTLLKKLSPHQVKLRLPKFELSTKYKLVDALKKLGLISIFSNQADLSGISGDRNLIVSDVVHKAMVGVSEEGTVATAATELKFVVSSGGYPDIAEFYVDHPFLFLICDTAINQIHFIGAVHKL